MILVSAKLLIILIVKSKQFNRKLYHCLVPFFVDHCFRYLYLFLWAEHIDVLINRQFANASSVPRLLLVQMLFSSNTVISSNVTKWCSYRFKCSVQMPLPVQMMFSSSSNAITSSHLVLLPRLLIVQLFWNPSWIYCFVTGFISSYLYVSAICKCIDISSKGEHFKTSSIIIDYIFLFDCFLCVFVQH